MSTCRGKTKKGTSCNNHPSKGEVCCRHHLDQSASVQTSLSFQPEVDLDKLKGVSETNEHNFNRDQIEFLSSLIDKSLSLSGIGFAIAALIPPLFPEIMSPLNTSTPSESRSAYFLMAIALAAGIVSIISAINALWSFGLSISLRSDSNLFPPEKFAPRALFVLGLIIWLVTTFLISVFLILRILN